MTDPQHTLPGPNPAGTAWAQEGYAAWMRLALGEAEAVGASGDVPIGAVVVGPDGSVLGRGHNLREVEHDPTGHAEVVALRRAGAALGAWRLDGCSLVVTLEPCAMCAGAAVLARVDRIVLGAWDPKAGACGSVWDLPRDRRALHRPEVVGGILEEECGRLLVDFFGRRRG
ncbi:tRNA adenosine(34) deaminase TadA [Ornithinimicrobium humiphilum]|uniref:tRNA-specific adenosine deaminase n=2 Tax=Ornithinimicrobium humiphilum TaxID=125288 RepID=A0A543K7V0_9MICO|nr:tRNA(adenine34) deaminase [Ornithinimicrobium humiphilum]